MDKVNELIAWFALTIGWWLYKSDCLNDDNGESEKVPAVVDMAPGGLRPPAYKQFNNAQMHDASIISIGLSDLMRKKPQINQGRRKEDQHAADQ